MDLALCSLIFSGLLVGACQASAKSYLAVPKSASAKPVAALLVLPNKEGINSYVERECDRWAEEGYGALAVDFYEGQRPSNEAEANRLWDKLDSEKALKLAQIGWNELKKSPQVDKNRLGAVSLGASSGVLFRLLRQNSDARVGVFVEGLPLLNRETLGALQVRLLGLYPARGATQPENLKQFESLLSELKLTFEIKRYEAGPGFMDYTRAGSYSVKAAESAKKDLQVFFKKFLSLEDPIKY